MAKKLPVKFFGHVFFSIEVKIEAFGISGPYLQVTQLTLNGMECEWNIH